MKVFACCFGQTFHSNVVHRMSNALAIQYSIEMKKVETANRREKEVNEMKSR